MTEGTTDVRFLSSIVVRTFEEIVLLESSTSADIYQIEAINSIPGTFIEKVVDAATRAEEIGINILCVHTDADSKSDDLVFENKINPAFEKVSDTDSALCKNLVAIVPIQMTEAWLLADLQLLKDELMTDESDQTLQLTRLPENIANPKEAIKNAINIAYENFPRRRRKYKVTIFDLYQPIGQKIVLSKLKTLSSFEKFYENAREILRRLNYLH